MFTDSEAQELQNVLKQVLEDNKAGRPDTRDGVAAALVGAAREFLAGKYSAKDPRAGQPYITKLGEVIGPDDYAEGNTPPTK
jgi:hypothetical protein